MSGAERILPADLVEAVEQYVESELDDARRYDNRQPLDDSGVWSLHLLAARIYAAGWRGGEAAEGCRASYERRRARAAAERPEADR